MLPLRELQSRFFHALSSGLRENEPQVFDSALAQVVQGGQLDSEQRLAIYANMYRARLLDVLAGDFERVAAIVGWERFSTVASAYLAEHPSTHPGIQYIGRRFAEFLTMRSEVNRFPFLVDLARLEWARVEAFDAPDATLLTITHLQAIPPEQWAELKLQLIPACRVLRSTWPIHSLWSADDETLQIDDVQPEKTVVRIWRAADFRIYHASIDAVEQAALDSLCRGEPFAAICGALEPVVPQEAVAQEAGSLLLRWIEDGILARPPDGSEEA